MHFTPNWETNNKIKQAKTETKCLVQAAFFVVFVKKKNFHSLCFIIIIGAQSRPLKAQK